MKPTLRIWLTALMLQPILFCFFLYEAALYIIPFEIAGSIPGILVFGLILKGLSMLKISLHLKWVLLLFSAAFLAFECSYLLLKGIDDAPLGYSSDAFLSLLPAPVAAWLAIAIHAPTVNAYLGTCNTREETKVL